MKISMYSCRQDWVNQMIHEHCPTHENTKRLGDVNAVIIYNYIADNPGCTRNEVVRNHDDLPINVVSGRVCEMKKSGSIFEDGNKVDPVTGKRVGKLYITDK